jgi:hypothetical protein
VSRKRRKLARRESSRNTTRRYVARMRRVVAGADQTAVDLIDTLFDFMGGGGEALGSELRGRDCCNGCVRIGVREIVDTSGW